MESRVILVNLLIKLGVAAAVASALVRSVEFKSLLFREERSVKQKIYLVLWIGIPLALGVWIRFSVRSFLAGDLSMETAVILGVIGGRICGITGGALLALPAVLHGEWATLPFTVLCGFVAGQLRNFVTDKEEIWSFSPFIDLSIYRWIRRNLPRPRLFDWQIMFFLTIVGLRFVHTELFRFFPTLTYTLESPNLWVEVAIYATSIMVVGTELKIWNSVKLQIKLEEQ
jgi:two-component system LytT family sensor kinase